MSFEKLDSMKVNFYRFDEQFRWLSILVVAGASLKWVLSGYDSGIAEYGKSMHWSFFVIYGLEYFFISRNLMNKGVTGTKNTIMSSGWVFFSVAIFEWFWMLSYYVFHGHLWILTNNWLIYPNAVLTLMGGVVLVLVRLDENLRVSSKNLVVAGATIVFVSTLWWTPPVELNRYVFPQTCYPQPSGFIIYVEDNIVHTLNLIAKAGYALAVGVMLRQNTKHRGDVGMSPPIGDAAFSLGESSEKTLISKLRNSWAQRVNLLSLNYRHLVGCEAVAVSSFALEEVEDPKLIL